MLKFVKDLKPDELRGKRVLLRVDFNVPIADGKVSNAYRIDRAMPTIEFLIASGAKLLLMSHIETKGVDHPTLRPVFDHIQATKPELKLSFLPSCFGDEANKKLQTMGDGEAILFENIRQYAEEKENNEAFAKSLASLADMYVNDAFAVCHRSHASVVGIPKFLPSYAGLLLEDEIDNLNVTENVERPFLFILGGAKFETKLPLIKKFLALADHVFVGGALANDVLKAKGLSVGKSLVSTEKLDLEDIVNDPKLIIPIDVVTKNDQNNKQSVEKKLVEQVAPDDAIMDIGPESIEYLVSFVKRSKYILWNGPFGNFETGFKDATEALAEEIGKAKVHSVVGGGDTLAAIQKLDLLDEFTFVSTGGGAMLDYLSDGTLVGIQALEQ